MLRSYLALASAARTAALCFTRAPLCRGEGAQEKPEGWPAGCGPVRCRHRDVPSANPVAPSRSRRLGAGDRGTEGALLFGYFLLGKQEKVTRSPAGERNACHEQANAKSKWIPAFAGTTKTAHKKGRA